MSDALDRLAAVAAAIEEAGGTITSASALALPETPDVLAAHWITAASPDPQVWADVEEVLRVHHVDVTGMVPWQPPEVIVDEGAVG